MINTVNLSGYLTKNPELKYSKSNFAFTELSINVGKKKYEDGKYLQNDMEVPVTFFGEHAENAAGKLSQGSYVLVSARVDTYVTKGKTGQSWVNVKLSGQEIRFVEGLQVNDSSITSHESIPLASHSSYTPGSQIDFTDADVPF